MKLSLHSVSLSGFFYRGKPVHLEELIPKVKQYGFDGVELMGKRPHANPVDLSAESRRNLRELASSSGLDIAAIAGYNDFSGSDAFKRELNILYVKELIKLARDLETDIVRVFAAGMTDVDPSIPYHEHWRLCVEVLKEVSRFAEDYGVTLALQNHPPIIESYEDVLDMVEEVGSEALKTCIDPELLIWVRDVDPYGEDALERFKTIYGRVGKLLVHVHVGDSIERAGKFIIAPGGGGSILRALRIERVPMGTGVFKRIVKPFAETLKSIGYNRYVSYEVCSPRYIKHKLIDFLALEYEIVNGVRFLKEFLS
ncbi:sugar phosphate isomerase/epimerase [Candidatus Bathyarchaeota archaeon]|nr:sugar phosphate isomerase/epimerase [Candidatus Bathyarchaeota archaeon]MBS7612736.1 sugar phosphate isomerase/epimerase [Candidatus Bathyarchaeota archaeon]MBS7618096.1 sugar phosphate isomerase/epimerase [Candidatus Bathyarchaeota archaeon]